MFRIWIRNQFLLTTKLTNLSKKNRTSFQMPFNSIYSSIEDFRAPERSPAFQIIKLPNFYRYRLVPVRGTMLTLLDSDSKHSTRGLLISEDNDRDTKDNKMKNLIILYITQTYTIIRSAGNMVTVFFFRREARGRLCFLPRTCPRRRTSISSNTSRHRNSQKNII